MLCAQYLPSADPQHAVRCRRRAVWRIATPQGVVYACAECLDAARRPWRACVVTPYTST